MSTDRAFDFTKMGRGDYVLISDDRRRLFRIFRVKSGGWEVWEVRPREPSVIFSDRELGDRDPRIERLDASSLARDVRRDKDKLRGKRPFGTAAFLTLEDAAEASNSYAAQVAKDKAKEWWVFDRLWEVIMGTPEEAAAMEREEAGKALLPNGSGGKAVEVAKVVLATGEIIG